MGAAAAAACRRRRAAAALAAAALTAAALATTTLELSATAHGGFSRDLLPCHEAIAAQLGGAADNASLAVLQWACAPAAPGRAGLEAAHATLAATDGLVHVLEGAYLERHYAPLGDLRLLPRPPPLERTVPPPPPPYARAADAATRLMSSANAALGWRAAPPPPAPESVAVSDPLPRLTVQLGGESGGGGGSSGAVRSLVWGGVSAQERARVEREAASVLQVRHMRNTHTTRAHLPTEGGAMPAAAR